MDESIDTKDHGIAVNLHRTLWKETFFQLPQYILGKFQEKGILNVSHISDSIRKCRLHFFRQVPSSNVYLGRSLRPEQACLWDTHSRCSTHRSWVWQHCICKRGLFRYRFVSLNFCKAWIGLLALAGAILWPFNTAFSYVHILYNICIIPHKRTAFQGASKRAVKKEPQYQKTMNLTKKRVKYDRNPKFICTEN